MKSESDTLHGSIQTPAELVVRDDNDESASGNLQNHETRKRDRVSSNNGRDGDTATSTRLTEHLMKPEEVALLFNTAINVGSPSSSPGLAQSEAERRLAKDGPNMMTPPKAKSPIILFLECLFSLFNVLLIVASVLTFILYGIDREANGPNVRFFFSIFYTNDDDYFLVTINELSNNPSLLFNYFQLSKIEIRN